MGPSGKAYNTDWIVSSTSNVHIANDRSWFTNYKELQMTASGLKVLGFGTVDLPVETDKGYNIVHLKNVLHTPESVCNIIGLFTDESFGMDNEHLFAFSRSLDDLHVLAMIDVPKLFRIRLAGYDPKQTSLDKNMSYAINARISDEAMKQLKEASQAEHLDEPKSSPTKTAGLSSDGSHFVFNCTDI